MSFAGFAEYSLRSSNGEIVYKEVTRVELNPGAQGLFGPNPLEDDLEMNPSCMRLTTLDDYIPLDIPAVSLMRLLDGTGKSFRFHLKLMDFRGKTLAERLSPEFRIDLPAKN